MPRARLANNEGTQRMTKIILLIAATLVLGTLVIVTVFHAPHDAHHHHHDDEGDSDYARKLAAEVAQMREEMATLRDQAPDFIEREDP